MLNDLFKKILGKKKKIKKINTLLEGILEEESEYSQKFCRLEIDTEAKKITTNHGNFILIQSTKGMFKETVEYPCLLKTKGVIIGRMKEVKSFEKICSIIIGDKIFIHEELFQDRTYAIRLGDKYKDYLSMRKNVSIMKAFQNKYEELL